MDPTAPKDNPQAQDPNAPEPSGTSPNPIQPGQFVVVGDDELTPKVGTTSTANQDNSPKSSQASPDNSNQEAPPPFTSPDEMLTSVPEAKPHPFGSQSSQASQVGSSNPIQSQEGSFVSPKNLSANQQPQPPQQPQPIVPSQPDPTPYTPVQPTVPPTQEPSRMARLKLLMIIVAIVVLVGIIGGVVWFFALGNNQQKESLKTEGPQEQIEELPLPKRTAGGFAELPQATNEATEEAEGTTEEVEQPVLPTE